MILSFCDNLKIILIFIWVLSEFIIEGKFCINDSNGEDLNIMCKEYLIIEFIFLVDVLVLWLWGGVSGEEEIWLCDICGKLFVFKRNFEVYMNFVYVSYLDFIYVILFEGLFKWKCSLCGNLFFLK